MLQIKFSKNNFMAKHARKKFTKEWVELTLCDMLDEVLQLMKKPEYQDRRRSG